MSRNLFNWGRQCLRRKVLSKLHKVTGHAVPFLKENVALLLAWKLFSLAGLGRRVPGK